MDRLIKRYNSRNDRDLNFIDKLGIAYQTNMKQKISYNAEYCSKFNKYSDKSMSDKINRIRLNAVKSVAEKDSSILDIGSGTGSFVKYAKKAGYKIGGYDVNPETQKILQKANLYEPELSNHDVYTFFDVLEHVDVPEIYFKRIRKGSHVIVSIPIFENLADIRNSKHYLPGEHLYYFTEPGFVHYMRLYGFDLVSTSREEIEAGRTNSVLFVFSRTLPEYGDYIGQYDQLHAGYYGSSSNLYFEPISRLIVKKDPKSILDYGCGRSDLVTYFWKDGARKISKYDPAIGDYKTMPDGPFDMVICNDVMEHIPMRYVDQVLSDIRSKSQNAIFTISLVPARAKLPSGENAHVTLIETDEWIRWIASYFGSATQVNSGYSHILMVRTF